MPCALSQIASWILQDAPLCLQWPLPLASLISIPAIMVRYLHFLLCPLFVVSADAVDLPPLRQAGASIYKLRTLGEPDGLRNYAEIP